MRVRLDFVFLITDHDALLLTSALSEQQVLCSSAAPRVRVAGKRGMELRMKGILLYLLFPVIEKVLLFVSVTHPQPGKFKMTRAKCLRHFAETEETVSRC